MDFIKKNWSRLSIALLFLLGGILGIVAFANAGVFDLIGNAKDFTTALYWFTPVMSYLVFFFGMFAIMIVKSCASKKAVSILYMVMGGLIALLNIIVLCVATQETSIINNAYALFSFVLFISPMLVFGFYPLIKGITRFIEAEVTPAPAKVAVKAETVVKTEDAAKAEEPAKTTVKKTVKKTTTAK